VPITSGARLMFLYQAYSGPPADAEQTATKVTQVTGSWDPHHRTHVVRVNFKVRHASASPLMPGFRWRSAASLVDNFGNAYAMDWKYPDRIVGIGIVGGREADASFALASVRTVGTHAMGFQSLRSGVLPGGKAGEVVDSLGNLINALKK
jgi:hypothetical protein